MPKKTIKKLITSLSSQLIESVRRRAGQRARGSGMADPRLSDSDLKEREGEGERDRAVDCLCSALLSVPVGRSVGSLWPLAALIFTRNFSTIGVGRTE